MTFQLPNDILSGQPRTPEPLQENFVAIESELNDITAENLAANCVTTRELAVDAVYTENVKDDAITDIKIANDTVGPGHFAFNLCPIHTTLSLDEPVDTGVTENILVSTFTPEYTGYLTIIFDAEIDCGAYQHAVHDHGSPTYNANSMVVSDLSQAEKLITYIKNGTATLARNWHLVYPNTSTLMHYQCMYVLNVTANTEYTIYGAVQNATAAGITCKASNTRLHAVYSPA